MSVLTVVRHGQASFLQADYDRLSPRGVRQSELLGQFWALRGARFDQVFYGPARRHRDTGDLAGKALAHWPVPAIIPEFDEFPADGVLAAHLAGRPFPATPRDFDLTLRDATGRWLRGELSGHGLPTWQGFCDDIESVLRRILDDAPRSANIAIFTSGGPSAAIARVALGLSYEHTLNLTWSPRNCSFTEYFFTPGRFSLSTFNATPHLEDPALLTYR